MTRLAQSAHSVWLIIKLLPSLPRISLPRGRHEEVSARASMTTSVRECWSRTVDSGEFQTSRGREETVAVLAAAHARRLQHVAGEVVVEWILAGRIAAVHRTALEAIDGAH